eukprot:2974941-Lingulodinium_polyedra.AAC.1
MLLAAARAAVQVLRRRPRARLAACSTQPRALPAPPPPPAGVVAVGSPAQSGVFLLAAEFEIP